MLVTPERYLSHGKKPMAGPEVDVAEQSRRHPEVEERHGFSYLDWVLIMTNFFLVFILLTRYIFAPVCCTDVTTGISNADIKILFGASEITPFENRVMNTGSGESKPDTEKKAPEVASETVQKALIPLRPPLPPSDTLKGYNPWLDEPRPTNIYDYLRLFEVIFIVDDSSSMEGKRWSEVCDALETVVEKASELNVATVSLRFLNNPYRVRGSQGKASLRSVFNSIRPTGLTPLGTTLKAVFDEHLNRIDAAIEKGEEYSKVQPLDIVVLTDGVPTDKGEDEPARIIANAVKRLNNSRYHPNIMGVQIIQIGKEKDATKALKSLVIGDSGRIVDTFPYAGIVDSQKLVRILLERVHPNSRSQLPIASLAT